MSLYCKPPRTRMSYAERQERRQARYYGKRCRTAIEHAVFHQSEASKWRALDGGDASDLTERWERRSDLNLQDAVSYATSAAHHARLAMAERDAALAAAGGAR